MLAVRLAPIKHSDNLHPDTSAKMDLVTTSGQTYQGHRGSAAKPIRPAPRSLGDDNSFSGKTENRDAFTQKPMERVKPFRLKDNSIMSGSFEGSSGYKDEFQARSAERTKSYAPTYEYRKPGSPFGNQTTSQADFHVHPRTVRLPMVLQKPNEWYTDDSSTSIKNSGSTYKHDFPKLEKGGDRACYSPPTSTLKLGRENIEISTNYKDDFSFKTQTKAKSYAPVPTNQPMRAKMDACTESKERFQGVFIPPPKSYRPKYEFDPDRPSMDFSSNYKDSFKKFVFISAEAEKRTSSSDPAKPTQN